MNGVADWLMGIYVASLILVIFAGMSDILWIWGIIPVVFFGFAWTHDKVRGLR